MTGARDVPHPLEAVGGTPTVQLRSLTEPAEATLVAKLEPADPGGSLPDRSAWQVIRRAEDEGRLRPGATIIGSSSGGFGTALAAIGVSRGYQVIAIVDPTTAPADWMLYEASGAEVIVVDQQDGSGSYHPARLALANRLHRQIPHSFRADKQVSPQHVGAHFRGTARELVATVGDRLTAVVCTVRTSGQLGGVSRYLARHAPQVRVVGVDIVGSTVSDWAPANLADVARVHEVYQVSDEVAHTGCRALVRHEGVLAGVSTGAALTVALRLAMQRGSDEVVALLVADRGEPYLRTAAGPARSAGSGLAGSGLAGSGLAADTSVEGLRTRATWLVPTSAALARGRPRYAPQPAAGRGAPSVPVEQRLAS
ncbi:MAG TPA: cysteine synthase family protein [Mycobacteriales bacterium]|nr:cysteine synthase family protein [Mycobacteriales bacterium]